MLEVGRVNKAHGVRGEVIVSLLTDRLERVAPGAVLYAGERPLTIVASRPHQKHHLVSFLGVGSRESAEALQGSVLYAEPIDDDDELWVHDVIGVAVVDVAGEPVGVVESVQANPASDLLVLDNGALVPAVFIVEQRDRTVVVGGPAALLGL